MCETIFAYSRREALADGVLVDISPLAAEAAFRFPVAVTSAVWTACIAVPEACPWQDETGRTWDILMMLHHAIKTGPSSNLIRFTVLVQNDEGPPQPVVLKATCGPGDDPSPVITIMFPCED